MKRVKLEPVRKGYARAFKQCRTCKRVYLWDYVPYSLSIPVVWTQCGHSRGHRDYNLRDIDEASWHRLREKELRKEFEEKNFK